MNIALLTAAGLGTRMHQDIPKQFIHIDNKPLIVYTMEAFEAHPSIDKIVVVTIESWKEVLWAYAKQFNVTKLHAVVNGGNTGQDSIKKGIDEIRKIGESDPTVLVHDGNRPLVTSEIISDALATFKKHGNAVATIPCTEVVFESTNGISSTVSTEREKLFRTQTPHVYRLQDIEWAHEEAKKRGITNTAATCMLMKELGVETFFSKGSEENIKITTVEDLRIFQAILQARKTDWIK